MQNRRTVPFAGSGGSLPAGEPSADADHERMVQAKAAPVPLPVFAAEAAEVAETLTVTRSLTPDITQFPFRAIVFLSNVMENVPDHVGTGFLIGNHVIATAAHNLRPEDGV